RRRYTESALGAGGFGIRPAEGSFQTYSTSFPLRYTGRRREASGVAKNSWRRESATTIASSSAVREAREARGIGREVDAVLELVAVRIDDADPTAEVERQRGHRFVVAIEEDVIEAARVDLASHAPPGERGLVRLHVIGEQRGERDRDRGAHHHRGERPAREDQHERGGGEEQRRLHEHGSARRPLRR